MKHLAWILLLVSVARIAAAPNESLDAGFEPQALYPGAERLNVSRGDTTYYIDPAKGDDANPPGKPWKSLAKINAIKLAPGDKVIIAPGTHDATLKPTAAGTADKPVVIQFLPGVHEFAVDKALRRPYFVSNSCDEPATPKPIGILIENCTHLRLQGGGVDGAGKTEILMGGRMIEDINDRSEDVQYAGLVFDLKRPTVSEFRVLESDVKPGSNSVVIQVAEGSTYEVKDGKFAWTGDIGKPGAFMAQQADPKTRRCSRIGINWDPFASAKAEDLGAGKVRLTHANGDFRMNKGQQFQFRFIARDSVGVHNCRSKDIVFRDCDFYALTNMGFVSQFTENITYQRVRVAPPRDTIRTCPAWGDIFQFSNCKGDILVDDCVESGMQDDAINCHGTHLRIVDKPAENQLVLRYMQPQTYGFAPYVPGDEIAVIGHGNLREKAGNPRRKVTACIPKPGDTTGKDWLITLDGPAPAFDANDVVDNITWYPNLTARNNHIDMDPVRGFLLTTRGKVVIEGNTFNCAMPGILIEDDAEGWFESGPVRDMLIRNNKFIDCGIAITPHTSTPKDAVHENIRIEGNFFADSGVNANSVDGLTVTGNRFTGGVSVSHNNCVNVKVQDNVANARE